jgi:threonylcarbamoyladenosine tRNA methylthiotransferase MtaB
MDPKSPLRISLATLGCKTNQNDAASLRTELVSQGHQIVPWQESADAVIIHTCTVTHKTDYQSRQLIRRAIAKNPSARIVVTGCYAQVSPQAIQDIPGVNFIVGLGERARIPGLVCAENTSESPKVLLSAMEEKRAFEAEPVPFFSDRSRAYLKIQDGCNSFCSYCIVPYARGRNRSLPLDSAVARVKELQAAGYKEVILTGIHLGTYGEDLQPPLHLCSLLQALEEEGLSLRLRLSSIEPAEFSPSLIAFLARSRILCPHLHIPLQSGDDRILKKMNRHYSTAFFEALVHRLVESIPDLAIGLDIIGGFPGEDERAFQNTLQLIAGLPIAYLHVFPFSRRKGTPAADMPDQVSSPVIKMRCRQLRALGERKRRQFYESFQGKILRVLIESKRDRATGFLKGYSRNYIPVLLHGEEKLVHQEIAAIVLQVEQNQVLGEMRQAGSDSL